jgi:hypothetical protein
VKFRIAIEDILKEMDPDRTERRGEVLGEGEYLRDRRQFKTSMGRVGFRDVVRPKCSKDGPMRGSANLADNFRSVFLPRIAWCHV